MSERSAPLYHISNCTTAHNRSKNVPYDLFLGMPNRLLQEDSGI